MSDLISDDYAKQLRAVHAARRWGDEGHTWAGTVRLYAQQLGAETILDYGCGRATLGKGLRPRYEVREYDPGIKGKDQPPLPADLVVTTDVLEHVEPDRLGTVLDHLAALTRRGSFHVISCRRAGMRLPDGRNAHLIIEPREFWIAQLERHGLAVQHWTEPQRGELCIWSRPGDPG